MYNYRIKDVLVVDGTGAEPYTATVLLKKDTIARIVRGGRCPAAQKTIDGKGLVLAPGFIDCHSHNDWLLADPDHGALTEPLIRQGVTTVATGQCGGSPAPLFPDHPETLDFVQDALADRPIALDDGTMDRFLARLTRQGVALNMAHAAGHGTLNLTLKGEDYRRPFTPGEYARLDRAVEESLEAGAFGVTFGLGYPPGILSANDEITHVVRIAARRDALVSVHLKSYATVSAAYPLVPGGAPHNVKALREVIDLARAAGARLQISHLIFPGRGAWSTADRLFAMIERERAAGLDVAFDAFPYLSGNTCLVAMIPAWFWQDFDRNVQKPGMVRRFRLEYAVVKRIFGGDIYGNTVLMRANHEPFERYEGRTFAEIARDRREGVFDSFFHLCVQTRGMARILIPSYYDHEGRDGLLAATLAHPLCRFETDTLITRRGFQNPATYGTFPKILGRYVRDLRIMGLADAVHRMTGASAARLGLARRGTVAEGNYADLVLFDDRTIDANPDPNGEPAGISAVFINGAPALMKGVVNRRARHGRVLRKNHDA